MIDFSYKGLYLHEYMKQNNFAQKYPSTPATAMKISEEWTMNWSYWSPPTKKFPKDDVVNKYCCVIILYFII